MTREYPEWRNDRDAQLHGPLVLYTRLIGKVCRPSSSVRLSCSRYSSRCRAHEMGVSISIRSLYLAPISLKACALSSTSPQHVYPLAPHPLEHVVSSCSTSRAIASQPFLLVTFPLWRISM